jgi:uncharacterized small protein (DUF1192 family)
MDPEDLVPPKGKPPPSLEAMSIAELEGRIAALEAEITRAREAIRGKQAVRGSADALFNLRK